MNHQTNQQFHIERLQAFDMQDSEDLGLLLEHLSEGADTSPIPEDHLRAIINSSLHEQLVAREQSSRIIGAATLSIVMDTRGEKAWLENFVTDPTSGHKGVGQALWNEMENWCLEKEVDLHFTSKPIREAAHRFYHKNGAVTRETTVFKKSFKTT